MIRLGDLRDVGAMLHAASQEQFVEVIEGICRDNRLDKGERVALYASLSFLADWSMNGAQVYELQHSIAAMLAATRAPIIEWQFTPLPFFILKVPSQFAPTGDDNPDTLIAVCPKLQSTGIVKNKNAIEWITGLDGLNEDNSEQVDIPEEKRRQWRVALRIAANAIAYITTHRECVHAPNSPTKGRIPSSVHTVSAPKDVIIEKAFRDQIAKLVSAGSLADIRKALLHVVRGHWRNQAVGPGYSERRLTWVRPHKRGDAALGRVVQRIEKLR